jgi:nitrilase
MSSTTPPSFNVAVVQAAPVPFNTPETIAVVDQRCEEAARKEARLAVFPEAFVGGYPVGLDFGTRIGLRTPEGREAFRRLSRAAIEVPGEATEALRAIAARHRLYLVIGVVERDGGTLYSSALYFSPSGELMGKHRKLMGIGVERYIWGFGDASMMQVFSTPIGKIGALLGGENLMPPARMTMYAQQMNLYCVPTVEDHPSWLSSMRMVAMEGRAFVISACQVLQRHHFPDDYPINPNVDSGAYLRRGGSCIINPMGVVLAPPVWEQECVITATVDLRDVERGKYDFDVVGHYARADIFTLHVNSRKQAAVVGLPGADADFDTRNAVQ